MSDTIPSNAPAVGRDFSMGRVVSQTFGVIRRNLLVVGVVALVISLLSTGLSMGLGFLIGYELGAGEGTNAVARMLGGAIGLVVGAVGTGAITHVTVRDLDGQRTGIGPAFATGLRLAFPLAGLGIVAGLGIGLACLLLLVPGIMLAMRWFVATPVRVVEGPGLGNALERSKELTAGSRWRLLGLAVIAVLFGGLLNGAAAYLQTEGVGQGVAEYLTVLGLVRVVASVIITSVSSTGFAVCYAELRNVKEGATPSQLASVFA